MTAFKLNQDYISKNTCENRYRPTLHCNGNCVLMKKISQQGKEEQNSGAAEKVELPLIIISSRSFFPSLDHLVSVILPSCFPPVKTGKVIDRPQPIFRPPAA